MDDGERRRETWVGMSPKINVKVEFLQKLDNYDYMKNPYATKMHPGLPLENIYTVNEHMAVTLSFVANTLVLLVFVRVLGLVRLPSRIIVNIAAANLFTDMSTAIHTTKANNPSLSNSESECRFVSFLTSQAWIVWFFSLSGAVVERLVACNMPSYYSRAQHILGPAIIISPWAYLTLNILLLHTYPFNEYDGGYECSNHLNHIFPHGSMNAAPRCTSFITALLMCSLIISMLLQNQSSGDFWDTNRKQFERRTSTVVIKLVLLSVTFTLPFVLSIHILRADGLTYADIQMIHTAAQISVHKGLGLMIVLLSRQEFRRQLVMVFESSETIRRARTTNLLIALGTAGNYSSRQLLPFSERSFYTSEASNGESVSTGRWRNAQAPNQVSTGHGKLGLVGRDKIFQVHTPEWLKKKDSTQQQGYLARLFNRTISMKAVSQEENNV